MGLRELRLKRGMTQQQLAEKVGTTRGSISAIEIGARKEGNLTLAMMGQRHMLDDGQA